MGPHIYNIPYGKDLVNKSHFLPRLLNLLGEPPSVESSEIVANRARRMKWWHDAKFGMFIHWGLYSVIGQHEWAMEREGIPVAEYELLAKHFVPQPHAAR